MASELDDEFFITSIVVLYTNIIINFPVLSSIRPLPGMFQNQAVCLCTVLFRGLFTWNTILNLLALFHVSDVVGVVMCFNPSV